MLTMASTTPTIRTMTDAAAEQTPRKMAPSAITANDTTMPTRTASMMYAMILVTRSA